MEQGFVGDPQAALLCVPPPPPAAPCAHILGSGLGAPELLTEREPEGALR